MKVEDRRSKCKEVENVNHGDCFLWAGIPYMVLCGCGGLGLPKNQIYAANLETGRLTQFHPTTMVHSINAVVAITFMEQQDEDEVNADRAICLQGADAQAVRESI